jgi:hypothetical protein
VLGGEGPGSWICPSSMVGLGGEGMGSFVCIPAVAVGAVLLVAHVQAVAVVVGFVILVGGLTGLVLGTRRHV